MRLAKYAWISVLTVASCHPEQDTEPKTLDFGRFTIVVPGSWQPVIKTGYDSYVGGIRAGGLGEIEFDYGRFASNLDVDPRSEEHTSELQSRENLVCRLLLEKKK